MWGSVSQAQVIHIGSEALYCQHSEQIIPYICYCHQGNTQSDTQSGVSHVVSEDAVWLRRSSSTAAAVPWPRLCPTRLYRASNIIEESRQSAYNERQLLLLDSRLTCRWFVLTPSWSQSCTATAVSEGLSSPFLLYPSFQRGGRTSDSALVGTRVRQRGVRVC